MAPLVTINKHTTASIPRPHILYTIEVTRNGAHTAVDRRYSEFVALNDTLQVTKYLLPPKRILATTFIPSAWLDDELIKERKVGLKEYVTMLVRDPQYSSNPILREFILPSKPSPPRRLQDDLLHLEDAVPSTLSRKAALALVKGGVKAQSTSIAGAYYPSWSASSLPPENLDYSKFDILFFAFATPNSSSGLTWDSGSQAILQRLVTSARNSGKGTKIVLSVGGWGGSYWYSQAVSSPANRSTFTNALSSAVSTYGLDGIDIDWEYPNSAGAGNLYASSDAANLLSLVQSLRSALGTGTIISAAVPHLPWIGSNGKPLTNVSAYAKVMTYVNIMNYDVWGASSTPGPNAPLGDLCGTSSQPNANAQAALSQWTSAGFPASQLLLGLPLYGYVSQSSGTVLSGSLMPSSEMVLIQGNEETVDGKARVRKMNFLNGAHARPKNQEVKAMASLQSWWGQQIPFSSLVSSGALVKNADGTYSASGGYTFNWDDCSDTPYLYNTSQTTVVTYDDTWSLADKATFAKNNGMGGCFTWSLDQDDGVSLMNVIRSSLGK
ncbi:glycoside hydrolase family 18 protein [Guyanagaster necrorhizus]|uniref:Glycoside hydrolase family 18 protein n=1 Tax=Guyanagaster necrorhizus TaxID=856835 RepID=A0A9P7VL91_9AGAR|nr:glycoside hydrolase family 18 protein [Guyanagaster necrorhizus MCA 3950]KAG7443203.1 glycoside hydrolase family 18 protein [Guyanagaster necrorhizus MCA 3950]